MTTEDREIQELREFRAGLAEPSVDALTRIRARVANRPAPRRWSFGNIAVPTVAAAAVLAVAIGAGVLAFDGTGTTGGSAQPPTSASEEPAPGDKTSSQPDPPAPADHLAAVELLERFAERAGTGPAPLAVPADRLLYIRGVGVANHTLVNSTGTTTSRQTYRHEMWAEPNGGIKVRIRRTDDGRVTIDTPEDDPKNAEGEIAEARERFASEGPGLDHPTPEYLAALPTDPDKLLALFRKAAADGGPWSADHAIMDYLRNFLYNNEPRLTPQVRAAVYRAMAMLPSISSTGQQTEIDGRRFYAITQAERGQRQELLIDAVTGRVAGSRSFMPESPEPTFYDLWTHAVVASVNETP